jgi:hypothetical protein
VTPVHAYWWRLTRPGWLTGAAAVGCAVVVVPQLLGGAGDLPAVVTTGHGVNLVLATAAAAPLRDPAAAVLDAAPYRRARRRLAPVGHVMLVLILTWPAIMAVPAIHVPGMPWRGLAVEAVAMIAIACAAGLRCADRTDPGLAGAAVLAVIVLIDQGTWHGPWLTGSPGPDWAGSREAWALLGAVGMLVMLLGLREPAGYGSGTRSRRSSPRSRSASPR